jgi:hypothetical protein
MSIFESFNDYIDKLLGLEKPITNEERQIIGMEVSNAMSAVQTLATYCAGDPAYAGVPIDRHVERILVGFAFEGSVTHFELAHFVDPQMPVIKFIAGVSEAFHLWPYLLTRSNRPSRRLFSYTVKDALFKNNETGWQGYVNYLRQRGLDWFGQEEKN